MENLQVVGGQVEIHLCSSSASDLWPRITLLLASVQAGDHINWPLTARDVSFFWKCLQWPCLKAVLVPTFVIGGLRGSTATSGSSFNGLRNPPLEDILVIFGRRSLSIYLVWKLLEKYKKLHHFVRVRSGDHLGDVKMSKRGSWLHRI